MGEKERSAFSILNGLLRSQVRGVNLWDGARLLLADVPLDERAVRRILPLGLRPSAPAMGTLFITDYPKTSFTVPYQEAALLVHVRSLFGPGVHCPWMTVNDDTALIYGRELLGYPKKIAEIEYREEGGRISGSVTRRGVRVLAMEAELGRPQTSPAPVFDVKTFNVGGPGQLYALNPLWLFRPKEKIHEAYDAAVKVEIAPAEFDPVSDLVSGAPVSGRMVVMDIIGSRYNLPVGIAGPTTFAHSYNLRYR